MKLLVIVNRLDELAPGQTTTMLARAAEDRGHTLYVAEATAVSLTSDNRLWARVRQATPAPTPEAWVRQLRAAPADRMPLDGEALVWIRTNPGRDPRGGVHATLLDLLAMAQEQGVTVVNDPAALRSASTKLYLSRLPAHTRPQTTVSSDPETIEALVRSATGPMVLKPLSGSRGMDVFRVDPGQYANLNQIIDVLVRGGVAMVQDYVPEAAEGDVRVVMLNGEVLVAQGRAASVRRVPSGRDFRSNVHVGGRPAMAEYDDRLRAVAEAVGPVLRRDGLLLAGLDVIGDKVVEVNVFSTGGLVDGAAFYGVDFAQPIIAALEALA